ncbi:MAG: hypothetical protein WCP85_15135 [Mariniphaga sp.]
MIQIFFKKSKISGKDWDCVYERILRIVTSFPLKLERIESFDGFSPELDKIHLDLTVDICTSDEHISFWGDQMSFSARSTIRVYKNWETQVSKGFTGNEADISKPITWFNPGVFDFSGYPPEANGCKFHHDYIDTEGALYQYAILAIGIMAENLLPGRAFLIAMENDSDDIHETKKWLEYLFHEKFDDPIYFDKIRLFQTLEDYYENKKDLVGRMDRLYLKQFKKNMCFAIEQIGYQPAFDYYSEVLSKSYFGTFGFFDILNPWIAATRDLESTLKLIAKSKEILLSDDKNKKSIENAGKYDYTRILKNLLDEYILWTPVQREQLERFYTNKNALETGVEDLFGSIMRISGNRVDICPIYANKEQLFEAFMYHEPQNGKLFLEIIDKWIDKNVDSYQLLYDKISSTENQSLGSNDNEENEDDKDENELQLSGSVENYAQQYAEPERFFVIEALKRNPAYMDIPGTIDKLQDDLWRIIHDDKNLDDVRYIQSLTKEKKAKKITGKIKEKRLSINPNFEKWLENENDTSVLTSLFFLLQLKIYDRSLAFARQCLLMDKNYWNQWKECQKYEIKI